MTNDLKKWLNKKESSKEIVTDSLIQKYKACLSADVDVKNLLGLHWCLTQPKETNITNDKQKQQQQNKNKQTPHGAAGVVSIVGAFGDVRVWLVRYCVVLWWWWLV